MIEIGTAGGVAEIAIGVAANLHVVAHYAEQHRAIVGQYRIVMQRVTNGAARELIGNQLLIHQLLIERVGDIIFNHQRVPGAQAVTMHKLIVDFGFDIDQCLIDAGYPAAALLIFNLSVQQRIAGINGEIVFGFTFTGKFHQVWALQQKSGRE